MKYFVLVVVSLVALPASAQDHTTHSPQPSTIEQAPDQQRSHEHQMSHDDAGWQLTQDGVLFGTYNHQGGARGGDEFGSENWWMGMASHSAGRGSLTLTGMLSLEPATVGKDGYREIFQVGEAFEGQPLVDRQHPHDFLMQASGGWRVPLTESTGLTLVGALVGEPTLGPVAFMHRPSAAENPTAPLSHHTFDSTHIAMGVVSTAVDREHWTLEGSLFNGREPDDDRWDLYDPGALDSWSARAWFRPAPEWELQVSTGHLTQPEEVEPGNVQRSTLSVSWFRERPSGFTAVFAAYGRNDKDIGDGDAYLFEATHQFRPNAVYGRLEFMDVELGVLLGAGAVEPSQPPFARVAALTLGVVRDVARPRGFAIGVGGDVTVYGVPASLESTYGRSPVSFHMFVRLRPPAPSMGRMWNMRMTSPMGTSHAM